MVAGIVYSSENLIPGGDLCIFLLSTSHTFCCLWPFWETDSSNKINDSCVCTVYLVSSEWLTLLCSAFVSQTLLRLKIIVNVVCMYLMVSWSCENRLQQSFVLQLLCSTKLLNQFSFILSHRSLYSCVTFFCLRKWWRDHNTFVRLWIKHVYKIWRHWSPAWAGNYFRLMDIFEIWNPGYWFQARVALLHIIGWLDFGEPWFMALLSPGALLADDFLLPRRRRSHQL